MPSIPSIKLNNGLDMPVIGLGTWAGTDAEEQARSQPWILSALKAGYNHIDTAQLYGTEPYVGAALKEAGASREDIFITTKLAWTYHSRIEESVEESLQALGTSYIDLFLMHWPQQLAFESSAYSRSSSIQDFVVKLTAAEENFRPRNPDGSVKTVDSPTFVEVWATMEKLLDTGKVKSIGVSNFSIKTLEVLLQTAKVVPAVNQIELHPYLSQVELVEYCKKKGIVVTAYAPTGYAQVMGDALIGEIAAKHGVSPAQVILAWHVARGTTAVPKSTNEGRQKENLNLPTLSAEDIKQIDGLDKGERLCNKPNDQGVVWGWTVEQMGW
ncbi:hypothetical protein ONZ45_g5239 [Pleurotus djamor]|nr:hypothetical protein ONZ45_g5239 [Pleurotus djamor]